MDATHDLELFVKAGRDGDSYGACPICQTIFQSLLYKASGGVLSFALTPINVHKPPDELRYISNRLPALCHAGEIYKDEEIILDHLNEAYPEPFLPLGSRRARAVTLDFFGKFSFYMRDVSHKPNLLLKELARIDNYLALRENAEDGPVPGLFLDGDELTGLDMSVLAKLQHVRVACRAFKGLEIATGFYNLKRYLRNAYQNEIFRKSCPPDEEIIYLWGQKVATLADCPRHVRHIVQNTLDTDGERTFTFDVPEDDPSADTFVNVIVDTPVNASVDTVVITSVNSTENAVLDTPRDATVDTQVDTVVITSVETTEEAVVDTPVNAEVDTVVITSVETTEEAVVDTPVNTQVDTVVVTSVETTEEAVVETPVNTTTVIIVESNPVDSRTHTCSCAVGTSTVEDTFDNSTLECVVVEETPVDNTLVVIES